MITQSQIAAVVERLAQAAQPERILLFGSHARGEAREESDLDLLVIETEVPDRACGGCCDPYASRSISWLLPR